MESKLFATFFRYWWRLAVLFDGMRALDGNDRLSKSPLEYGTALTTLVTPPVSNAINLWVLKSNQI